MEIEDALTIRLKSTSALTALIAQRIFPDEAPQNTTLPYLIYLYVSDVKLHTLTGQYDQEEPMIQFTAYASTKSAARAITNQVKIALSDFQGTLSGIYFSYIRLENEMSSLITSSDGTIRTYTSDLEYEVNFTKED